MTTPWILSLKPTFLTELCALPPKEAHQIQEKLALLVADPTPDAKVKKQLKYLGGRLHRLRSGHYRVFYTFEQPYISLLALRRRDDETYDEEIDPEFLGGLDPSLAAAPARPAAPAFDRWIAPPPASAPKRPLPEPLTPALLKRLRVPAEHIPRLLRATTQEDLLATPGVPDDLLLRLDEALFERPLSQVLAQPDLVAPDGVTDLLRFREGELLGFLLRLDPEQEKYVTWGLKAAGPTLLKGGPGTGKSTVALYRARAMIAALRKPGAAPARRGSAPRAAAAAAVERPQLLFTTYTNALVAFSRQLLRSLLGDDASCVDVRTADSLVIEVLEAAGERLTIESDSKRLRQILSDVAGTVTFPGNRIQQRAQTQAIIRLPTDYLLDEILTVIEARRLASLEQYLVAPRPGRQIALNATQRTAVWHVREAFNKALVALRTTTWSHARARAASLIEQGTSGQPSYDAVIVDEAQDLEPSVLQVLVGVCKAPNRLFLTADANQSIYGAGFRWSDVHASLAFTGRIGVLRANHRSTREVGEAAQQYLAHGALDDDGAAGADSRTYVHAGPLPVVRAVATPGDEVAMLARFLPGAAAELRQGIGSCAVVVPTERAGKRIAQALGEAGVAATYMTSKELDLARPGVKVLTLKSCKGLEFPIVAVAGFFDAPYPPLRDDALPDERAEILGRERRTMFVAMTRAMRALLVVVPAGTDSPLLTGFDPALWNLASAPAPASEAS